MSIDMSQFYQVFFDEAAEHLANMESLLLALDLGSPDPDQLNAIFRAAHSIKGGSGTFGFSDMAEVTHILETLLDRIRKNEMALTHEMVDAFLQAGDVLHGLLEAHQNGTAADETATMNICVKLDRLANGVLNARKAGEPITDSEHTSLNHTQSSQVTPLHNYRITFPLSRDEFPEEAQLRTLLEDLENLGKLENRQISADTADLTLSTYASEGELREIFSFFLKPDQLTIDTLEDTFPEKPLAAEQSYGLFVQPAQKGSTDSSESKDGYGFFVSPEAVKSGVENAQGYGFFGDLSGSAQSRSGTAEPGSLPEDEIIPQRRSTDKIGALTGGDTSIRVSVGKVDKMVNLVGELVITQAMLAEIVSRMDASQNERLVNGLVQLERNTRDLQDSVMSVRMMPINLVFSRFQRVVRDSAVKLNKKVQLKIIGEGTELDKGLIEKISDPLTHLVRNSLDHGIEFPEERIARGKDPQGTITLRAAHQGGNIVIEVTDDGAGLNREKILAKAREKNMPVSDTMSDAEVWQLIYAPGFSTAAVVTDVSGRGVGMDVVKKNIESIGGRVEVTSVKGQGSQVLIRLPLTLAILDGMSIGVGDQVYIVPLSFIVESFQPVATDINSISGQQGQLVHVRGEYLPLIALHQVFNIETQVTDPTKGILVLLETETKKVALFVDELLGQHQVVIKSLETNYRKIPGISGATIMGDGRVALIVDVGALVKLV